MRGGNDVITFSFEGTSHGKGYKGVIHGLPTGFCFDVEEINAQLALRKQGIGRSSRQTFDDVADFGGQKKVTVNGDVEFFVANRCVEQREEITALRSGHCDVTGKARFPDMTVREIAEVASARNSVCYVVLGAICKQLLRQKGVFTYHYVERIGKISSRNRYVFGVSEKQPHFPVVHCPCRYATEKIVEKIQLARQQGNSLGGVVAVGATGVPCGVGEILPYSARLDAQIAANLLGIPSVKGISFGQAEKNADSDGVSANDKLGVENGKIVYLENKCGGIVGGISNGKDILCHLTVKPVPTVKGLTTVDSKTLQQVPQHYERADTCVVPNVGVIAENILAYVIANQMLFQRLI